VQATPSPLNGRQLAIYGSFYLAALLVAAAIGTWRPELAWKAKAWGSLVGSVQLGWFALGGQQLAEMRRQSRWRVFLPYLDRYPAILCFLFGLLLVDVFSLAFSRLVNHG
jgi:hypothetical protein